jgi:hypothetical protein
VQTAGSNKTQQMPLKWKIFLGLNFLLSLPAFICFILLLIDFLNRFNRSSNLPIVFGFLFGLLIIPINGFLNIYVLQRFFPDKLLPRGVKNLNSISIILNTLVGIAWLILTIYGATIAFDHYSYESDPVSRLAVLLLGLLWIIQVIVLIMQAQLSRTITRNNRQSIHSLIDSIGQQ